MPTGMLCQHCYHANRSGARFCAVCGSRLAAATFTNTSRPTLMRNVVVGALLAVAVIGLVVLSFARVSQPRAVQTQRMMIEQRRPTRIRDTTPVAPPRRSNQSIYVQ